MNEKVRPKEHNSNNSVNIASVNSEKVSDENLISMLPLSLVNDIVNSDKQNDNEQSENNNSTKPFEEDKYSYTMEDSQQLNNPNFNDFKNYKIFHPNGKYYSQEVKGKTPTPTVTLPAQVASSTNVWRGYDFSPEVTKLNPNSNTTQTNSNGASSQLHQNYGSCYEDFDNQGMFFGNPQINQPSSQNNFTLKNNSPTNQPNFHSCQCGNGINYPNFPDMNSQTQPTPTQNYQSSQNYYYTYKPFYPKNSDKVSKPNHNNHYNNVVNKFSKPQRNYQSQEFNGQAQVNYKVNEMGYPCSNSSQNIIQLQKSPYEGLDTQQRSPETKENNFTQNFPRMQNSQEFNSNNNNNQFSMPIGHKYSMDVKTKQFTHNAFNMNELITEVPNYSPKKKYSEGVQNNDNFKFNSKTMSIMEKKNRDDTKNLTDFLNSLDEDLIDYVRTQKGSR